ncbi:hypothetical protein AAFC00_002136 [Neodothiora populina]|uniref:DUF2241 domain-containing protein n=1 Tax=Neodothiora populina TaxID=2781224 RepID=A0ABR3PGD7_9PEZI
MTSQGGTSDLSNLIRTMRPTLHPSTFIFCHILSSPSSTSRPQAPHLPSLPTNLEIQCLFREAEGWTLIATEASLQRSLEAETEGSLEAIREQVDDASNRWCMITLNVHSSLLAVGFIAAVAQRLKMSGIPSNVIAGYFHDHIFVPEGKVRDTMVALEAMSREQS